MVDDICLFDLAISYARSDEKLEKKVFNELNGEFNIFYDINQYDLLVCKYLHEILYDVFYKQSGFALMIISSNYLTSPHTMWEARNIIARSIDMKKTDILLYLIAQLAIKKFVKNFLYQKTTIFFMIKTWRKKTQKIYLEY